VIFPTTIYTQVSHQYKSPRIAVGAPLGAGDDGYHIHVEWAQGMSVLIEYVTDLRDDVWEALATLNLENDTEVFHAPVPLDGQRFYRLRMP